MTPNHKETNNAPIYDFVVKDEDNRDVKLDQYRGQVLLIINSATECGFTDQYDLLQPLYERYQDKGFVILDFPCNQFGAQAPGTIKEIVNYCDMEYAITFPILNKIDVNGEKAHPLFTYLKSQKKFKGFDANHPLYGQLVNRLGLFYETNDIQWNFTKFLVDREGNVLERYEPTTNIAVIEERIVSLL